MNILLACKAEPDLSMLSGQDWQAAAAGNVPPDPSLMRSVMGSDEQGAAELLLQARDGDPGLQLSALTLGDVRAESMLRYLAALGFAQRILLNCSADLRFAPAFIAGQIARYVEQHAIDMVVLGTRSSEGQNGQTGWLLAEQLGWPCLTQVAGLVSSGTGLDVLCETHHHRQRWHLQQPAVLMVQNRGQMALRVPGMRARMAAATAVSEQIQVHELPASQLQCLALEYQPHRRAGVMIAGENAREQALRLWQDHLAQRMR